MKSKVCFKDVFGFIKPSIDVHTMGIYTISNLLRDCGYKVVIAKDDVNEAIEKINKINNYSLVKKWICENNINRLGFSYRLDPKEGCDYFMALYLQLKNDNMMVEQGGLIKEVSFAGLPDTCDLVKGITGGKVVVFPGNEQPVESLKMYGVPENAFHDLFINDNEYDNMRWDFAKKLVESECWRSKPSQDHYGYKDCGGDND